MPIPVIAIGAAGAAALVALAAHGSADNDAGPAQDELEGDTVASSVNTPSDLSAQTLSWSDELAAQAPELDTSFLLRWIQRESDGNPAAVGSTQQLQRDGWAREAGIGQVYFETSTQRVFGVTTAELRAGASSGQSLTRDLTAPERQAQTSSLILMARQYIVDGGNVLQQLGQTWVAEDIYCLAKLKHALPVLAGTFLLHCPDASSWDTFRAWLEGLSLDDSRALYSNAGAYYPWTRYLNNAQYTGRGS